ncbi:MAG: glycosyltransferase [Chryseobacterium sp.]|nr:MAG: glycosyltransferase [Chryseobacterium sp.]
MGIVHIILGKANPEKMNGVNKVVYNLATKQAEKSGDVEVWGIVENTVINYPERNFKTKVFQKNRNPFSIPKTLKKELLNADLNTVFHFHGGWIPVFYSLSQFLKKHQRRFVMTPHGAYNTIAMNKNKWVKKIYFRFFEKKLIRNAAKIHCIGESETEGLQSIFPTSKTVLITYGYDRTATDFPNKYTTENIIFGFIGRLDIYTKGLDILVDSFSEFSKEVPDAKLWIIGDSNEKHQFEQKIKDLHLEKKVELLGSKFGEEKNSLLNQIDVFVHPSRNEGLPVSVLEAADFGKPCIVTKNTNIGFFIDQYNAGITIPNPDRQLLLMAMREMHTIWKDRKRYQTMSQNAVEMVENAFNWDRVISEMNSRLYNL